MGIARYCAAHLDMSYKLVPFFSRRRIALAFALVFPALLVTAIYIVINAGNWLVREDPPEKGYAVVVLTGGLPERALSAAQIFRSGYAREVWLTQPMQPGTAMEELKLPYAGEQEYSRMVLIAKGVPPTNIVILRNKISNTEDELREVARQMDAHPGSVVTVITSGTHTRRVHTLWNHIGNPRGRIVVRATPEDYFDREHWWRTTNGALSVVREYLGLFNAWAGLPLHHSA
jgi:uncharacterized SAM-binding protein YcdF (DUF218 family)